MFRRREGGLSLINSSNDQSSQQKDHNKKTDRELLLGKELKSNSVTTDRRHRLSQQTTEESKRNFINFDSNELKKMLDSAKNTTDIIERPDVMNVNNNIKPKSKPGYCEIPVIKLNKIPPKKDEEVIRKKEQMIMIPDILEEDDEEDEEEEDKSFTLKTRKKSRDKKNYNYDYNKRRKKRKRNRHKSGKHKRRSSSSSNGGYDDDPKEYINNKNEERREKEEIRNGVSTKYRKGEPDYSSDEKEELDIIEKEESKSDFLVYDTEPIEKLELTNEDAELNRNIRILNDLHKNDDKTKKKKKKKKKKSKSYSSDSSDSDHDEDEDVTDSDGDIIHASDSSDEDDKSDNHNKEEEEEIQLQKPSNPEKDMDIRESTSSSNGEESDNENSDDYFDKLSQDDDDDDDKIVTIMKSIPSDISREEEEDELIEPPPLPMMSILSSDDASKEEEEPSQSPEIDSTPLPLTKKVEVKKGKDDSVLEGVIESADKIACTFSEIESLMESSFPVAVGEIKKPNYTKRINAISTLYSRLYILYLRSKDKRCSIIEQIIEDLCFSGDPTNTKNKHGKYLDEIYSKKGVESHEYKLFKEIRYILCLEPASDNYNKDNIILLSEWFTYLVKKGSDELTYTEWPLKEFYQYYINTNFVCKTVLINAPNDGYISAFSREPIKKGEEVYMVTLVEKNEDREKKWSTGRVPTIPWSSKELTSTTRRFLFKKNVRGRCNIFFEGFGPDFNILHDDKMEKQPITTTTTTVAPVTIIDGKKTESVKPKNRSEKKGVELKVIDFKQLKDDIICKLDGEKVEHKKGKRKRKNDDNGARKKRKRTKKKKKKKLSNTKESTNKTIIPSIDNIAVITKDNDGDKDQNHILLCEKGVPEGKTLLIGNIWKSLERYRNFIDLHNMYELIPLFKSEEALKRLENFDKVLQTKDMGLLFTKEERKNKLPYLILDLIDILFVSGDQLDGYKELYKSYNPVKSHDKINAASEKKKKKKEPEMDCMSFMGMGDEGEGEDFFSLTDDKAQVLSEEDTYDYSGLYTDEPSIKTTINQTKLLKMLILASEHTKKTQLKQRGQMRPNRFLLVETGVSNLSEIEGFIGGNTFVFVMQLFNYMFPKTTNPKNEQFIKTIQELNCMGLFIDQESHIL